MELILYHLVLVVGGWLVKMLKIVEKLSGLYGSATIHRSYIILYVTGTCTDSISILRTEY